MTEYMPGGSNGALVINSGLTGTIYLGTTSSVSPANGVPVPGGVGVPWILPGILYVYLDPATTSTAQDVIVTADIKEWNPSPVAIAAALFAQGLPSVFQDTTIITAQSMGSFSAINKPCAQYGSLAVYLDTSTHQADIDGVIQFEALGDIINQVKFHAAASPVGPTNFGFTVPVIGDTFNILNTESVNTLIATVIGTNRLVPGVIATGASENFAGPAAVTNGAAVLLGKLATNGKLAQISVTANFTGELFYSYTDLGGNASNVVICNFISSTTTATTVQVILPLGITTIGIVPSATVAAGAICLVNIVGQA